MRTTIRVALAALLMSGATARTARAQADAAQPKASAGTAGAVAGTRTAGLTRPAEPPKGQPLTGAALDMKTKAVASQLRCPVCQGESIDASPSELAVELKSIVKENLAAGYTEEQVKGYFVGKYGEWILLEPQAAGFNYAVYLLPPLALVAGAAFVYFMARRWTKPAPARVTADPTADTASR